MNKKDEIYRKVSPQIVDFAFDASVAEVFPDMVRRSVPGYETVIPLTGLIAARHAPENGKIFDLGCSLGASSLAILHQLGEKSVKLHAVDNSPAMIERAKKQISDSRCAFYCADILETDFTGADVIVMNYVLQFIAPEKRLELVTRMQEQMNSGGLLIVSEKIRFTDEAVDELFTEIHHDYKRANGYTELEVSQKRTALENVMVIDTHEQHYERFAQAQFHDVKTWYKCLNWASFMVTK